MWGRVFPHRGCLWKWFPIIDLCVFVCVSSCVCTSVSDAARSRVRGLGLVNLCPRLPAPHLRLLWVLARVLGPLAHPRALDCQCLQGRAGCAGACSVGCILGGPSHGMGTVGERTSLLCAGTLRAQFAAFCPSFSRTVCGAGCPLCWCPSPVAVCVPGSPP